MSTEAKMPGYWRFVWMFWMQPITLHYCLNECGVTESDISGWNWWRNRAALGPAYRQYIARLFFNLCLIQLIFLMFHWFFAVVLHWPIRFDKMIVIAALVAASAVITGIALDVAFSVALNVALSVAVGMAIGVAPVVPSGIVSGIPFAIAFGVVFGVAVSISVSIALAMATGMTRTVQSGVTVAIMIGLLGGVAGGLASSLMDGVAGGLAGGLTAAFIYLRTPIYLPEALWQALLPCSTVTTAATSLRYAPVLYHDLSFFPHPGLRDHIITAAKHDAPLARHVIEVAQRSPGQRKQATQALAALMTEELTTLFLSKNWPDLIEMRGFWLNASNPLLKPLAECAQFMFAAQQSSSNHLRLHSLQHAQARLHALSNQLLSSDDPLAQTLPVPLRQWQAQVAQELEATTQLSALEVPNPFTVGNPILPNGLWSKTLFRGRERTVAQVEQLLTDANNHAMALIGPRRCGKSSLLNMLPVLLPDSIIVQFDLQDNPADTPLRFYQGLAKVAQSQARRSHDLELPDLDDTAASPIEALKQWFEQLENFSAVPRILLCIDEFERLETLFPDKERELPQFMGVIRATIQHKRRLRLLVAGAAPFADLGPIWNDHFINLREIKIGYFDHATATGLLTKPMPEFPDGTISQTVADEVFARSKGQPFLTQAYGHGLVNILNEEKRKQATLLDLEQVEPEILQECTYYFRSIWQEVPPAGQAVLEALAHGQPAHMDTPTRLWLRRRMVMTEDELLAIPLFGRWIREKDLV